MNPNIKGTVLVFVGAICFSVKAIMIKLAYQYQVDPLSLLTLRMSFALPFFIIAAVINKTSKPQEALTLQDYLKIIGLGLLGYYMASIFDFIGLQYISAGLERLILFVYPTMVVVISYFVFKKSIGKQGYIALTLTYIGICIVFLDGLAFDKKNSALGALLIFGSAFAYAIYLVGSGRLIPRLGSIRFTAYAMIVSSVAVIIHFLIARPGNITAFPMEIYIYALAIAIFSTVIPTFLFSEGINLIGASKTAIIASVGPITTITLEYFILKEPITIYEIFGTIFVMAGVLMVSLNKSK